MQGKVTRIVHSEGSIHATIDFAQSMVTFMSARVLMTSLHPIGTSTTV